MAAILLQITISEQMEMDWQLLTTMVQVKFLTNGYDLYVKNSKVFINNNATNRSNSRSDKPYGQLKIGDARSDVGQHWDGKIALVRVYNRGLSDQEISINYDGFNAVINSGGRFIFIHFCR